MSKKGNNGRPGTVRGIRMTSGVKETRAHYERQTRQQTYEKWERLAGGDPTPICGASLEVLEKQLREIGVEG